MKIDDFIVGDYYKDIDDKDIIKILKIVGNEVTFEVIEDPSDLWENDVMTGDIESDFKDFIHLKAYNSPLYKVINK